MMSRWGIWWFVCLCCLAAGPTFAHNPSDSYLTLDLRSAAPTLRVDIALRDLEYVVGIDADRDRQITWHEVQRRQAEIQHYAGSRLTVDGDRGRCTLHARRQQLASHTNSIYAALVYAIDCAGGAPETLAYHLLFDVDPTHRGVLRTLTVSGETLTILAPDQSSVALNGDQNSRAGRVFVLQFVEGVRHIAGGFDHLLFLCTLILPSVLIRRRHQWVGVDRLGAAGRRIVAVVTAFTLAHSLTLALAVFGVVAMPGRWVESAIAATVVISAANNVRPFIPVAPSLIAFTLGLVHGFGFASALSSSGSDVSNLVVHLIGFNLGVELGQLGLVLVLVPIAYLLRDTLFYRRVGLQLGSFAIALVATVWFVERSLDLTLFAT